MRSKLHMGVAMIAITGLGIIADAAIFFRTFGPSLFIVSGLEAALGLVMVVLTWYGIRRGYMWAWVTALGAFLLVLLVVFPLRYVYGLAAFPHLGMYYMGVLMFMGGAFIAFKPLRDRREHETAVGSGSHVLRSASSRR